MDTLETAIHSFVVRLWCEEPEHSGDPSVWRGHVTHVATGRRDFVRDLDEIKQVIASYLRDAEQQPPG